MMETSILISTPRTNVEKTSIHLAATATEVRPGDRIRSTSPVRGKLKVIGYTWD